MIEWFKDILDKFGEWLLNVLPTSPFQGWIASIKGHFSDYLGYLNYFVPISDFLKIFAGFLAVVSVYYLYSIIMRWVKML